LSTPELLCQIGNEREGLFAETSFKTEFFVKGAVYQDGQFKGKQASENKFPPMRAKTHITHASINMLLLNRVEGFMKIYL